VQRDYHRAPSSLFLAFLDPKIDFLHTFLILQEFLQGLPDFFQSSPLVCSYLFIREDAFLNPPSQAIARCFHHISSLFGKPMALPITDRLSLAFARSPHKTGDPSSALRCGRRSSYSKPADALQELRWALSAGLGGGRALVPRRYCLFPLP